jgi:hypothetical protein
MLSPNDLRNHGSLLTGILRQDDAGVLPAALERSALLPVQFDELFGYVVNLEFQRCP